MTGVQFGGDEPVDSTVEERELLLVRQRQLRLRRRLDDARRAPSDGSPDPANPGSGSAPLASATTSSRS